MDIIEKTKKENERSIDFLNQEYAKIRAGRANPSILDDIMVDYYETPTPLKQLANISVPEARQIAIKPFDKSTLKNIEDAILKNDIGIIPQNDGDYIRLNIPKLTEETRKKLVKDVKKIAENAKVSIRNNRREANDFIKKDELSEDQKSIFEENIQKLTDDYINKIDKIFKEKEKELLTV